MISANNMKKELELPKLICKYHGSDVSEYYLDWKECEELKIKKYNDFLSNKNKFQIKNFGIFVPELNEYWNNYLKIRTYKLNKKSFDEFYHYRKMAILEYSKDSGEDIAIKAIQNMHNFLLIDSVDDYSIESIPDIHIHYTLFHLKILAHIHPLTNLGNDSQYFFLDENIEQHKKFKIFYAKNYPKIIESYTILPKDSITFKRRIRTEKLKRIKN